MTEQRITRWKEVAELLEQGWRVDGFDLVSPTGERRSAWGNAIKACRDRGLIPSQPPALSSTIDEYNSERDAYERGERAEPPNVPQ